MKRTISTLLATVMIVAGVVFGVLAVTSPAAQAGGNHGSDAHKWYVCKYVGKPGVDERLQTGQNPIFTDEHAIATYPNIQIGDEFADAQGRSVVILGPFKKKLSPEPDPSICPPVTPPTTEPTSPPTTEPTSPPTTEPTSPPTTEPTEPPTTEPTSPPTTEPTSPPTTEPTEPPTTEPTEPPTSEPTSPPSTTPPVTPPTDTPTPPTDTPNPPRHHGNPPVKFNSPPRTPPTTHLTSLPNAGLTDSDTGNTILLVLGIGFVGLGVVLVAMNFRRREN